MTMDIERGGEDWADSPPKITLVDDNDNIFADGSDTGQTVSVKNGAVTKSVEALNYYTLTLTATARIPDASAAPPAPGVPFQAPQTGDDGNMGLWLALLAVSACGMLCALLYCKRQARGK